MMKEIRYRKGETTLEMSYGLKPAGDAVGEDAPADMRLHVITIIKPQHGRVRCCTDYYIDLISTLRRLLIVNVAMQTISAKLSGHRSNVLSFQLEAAATYWLMVISTTASTAANEALYNRTGFTLRARVRIFVRPELHNVASSICGYVAPSASGEIELAGGVGLQALRFDSSGRSRELACPICFDEFVEGAELMRMRRCSHEFHRRCISRWFECKVECPLCRRNPKVITTNGYGH